MMALPRPSFAARAVFLLTIVSSAYAQDRKLLQTGGSSLWGKNGERFQVGGRLLDYSYAGYAAGEEPIPTLTPTHNVKTFGAKGDGQTDDTGAFLKALAAMGSGSVLRVPAGKYVITKSITINKRVSIKGDGSSTTSIIAPVGTGNAILNVNGNVYSSSARIGDVSANAKRGANIIQVSSTKGVKVGEWYAVTMASPSGGNLFLPINMGLDKGCTDAKYCKSPTAFQHISRVAQVNGNNVVLERPLPWDLYPTFTPISFYAYKPQIANIGIEGLFIDMRPARYLGHFKETGYSAITLSGVANSWVRDVRIQNCDYGIVMGNSVFVTLQNITLTATAARMSTGGESGHHGLEASVSADILITNFNVATRLVHDVTVNKFAQGVVITKGQGIDMNMDHHKAQNYGALWTGLDLGAGTRAYNSGGSGIRGLHAGAFTTFWNIKAKNGLQGRELTSDFGPYLNFVGLTKGSRFPALNTNISKTWLVENLDQASLSPANLYDAMSKMRLAQPNKVSAVLGGKGNGGRMLSAY